MKTWDNMDSRLTDNLSEHVPRMYRVALRIVGDPHRAEDVVQDACLKALRSMAKFQHRSSQATWLHRITVNCARDDLRQARRSAALSADCNEDLLGVQAALNACPALRAERNELSQLAGRLVGQLPDDCRTEFILTQLDGYSYDQVAEMVGQPRGTVATRVYRAKRILFDQFQSQDDGRLQ